MAQTVKYAEVKIQADATILKQLAQLGLAVDEGFYKKGESWTIVLSYPELDRVKAAGLKFEILHDDYSKYISDRNKSMIDEINSINSHKMDHFSQNPPAYPVPQHFKLGSMGGFYNLQEVLIDLDSMVMLYPNLITPKAAAGDTVSIQGRSVYYVKISDNPNVNENEPKVYYNSLIHAREPEGMQQMMYFMWYILENYSTSPEIQYLVDNLEIFFVPVVNPDGYEYNHSTFPYGGGLWRKNRRNNGDGTYGVDLNRNFGYEWGYDNIGSSPNTYDETYRGTAPFSEPETRVQRSFCDLKEFRLAHNYHTYSDDVLYPWCYINQTTPDDSLIFTFSDYMTHYNRYISGTPGQILYPVNGDALDWQYGEQTEKSKIICFTTEVGDQNDGFWPPANRIIPLAQENMYSNFILLHFALRYAEANDISPVIIPDKQGYFKYQFTRYGMDAPANYSVSIQPLDTLLFISAGPGHTHTNPAQFQQKTDSISYTLSPDITIGTPFRYIIKITNGLYTFRDTITKYFGPPLVVFQDNCNTMTNWTSNKWNINLTVYHSPNASITDSPYGYYQNNANYFVTSNTPTDLTNSPVAVINYYTRWDLERGFDYVQFSVSDNNGTSWTPQGGLYTTPGTKYEAHNQPVYDGLNQTWVREQMVLTDYANKSIKYRFQIKSDANTNGDGFYFDDFSTTIIDMTGVGITNKSLQNAFISDPMPDPASDHTVIRYNIPQPGNASLSVLDARGLVISRILVDRKEGSITIPLNKLASGIYFVRISGDFGSTGVRKLIVIR